MYISTQISGHIHPQNAALHALTHMFTQLGIHVTQPLADESFFYKTDMNTAWLRYNDELDFYSSIANSNFHIIYNEGKIDEALSQQILYAMIKDRPILMAGKPVFASKVSTFTRNLITNHVHEFHSTNLPELDLTELSLLLGKLRPMSYRLSGSEKILINARVKAHFRQLLDEAKDN